MADHSKKILVTGSSGLIGKPLYERLVAEGHEVVGVDNNSRFPDSIPPYATFDMDVTKFLSLIPNDFDVIYHMAAINGTSNFYSRPNEVAQNNIACDMAMMQFAEKNAMCKLVYASSSELVAGTDQIPTPEQNTVTIEDIHNPRWSYRLPKIIAENYLFNSNINFLIIRFYNVYSEYSGKGHFLRDIVDKIKQKDFTVASPHETRSFCYVNDAVDAVLELANTESRQVFNVGSDEEITVLEAAQILADEIAGEPVQWNFVAGKEGSVQRRCPDLTKTRQVVRDFYPRRFKDAINMIKDRL